MSASYGESIPIFSQGIAICLGVINAAVEG